MSEPSAEELSAAADLLRVSEPMDQLLAAVVRVHGCVRARELAAAPAARALSDIVPAAHRAGLSLTPARIAEAHARWQQRLPELDAQRDLRIMKRLGCRLVVPGSEDWPSGLADLGLDAPLALWARGPAPLRRTVRRSIAVVGSRAASGCGAALAKNVSFDLARHGITVVSGGAFGIDAAAHAGALAAASDAPTTIALMAGGVDRMYPRGNAELLADICRRHLVVSESPPGAAPMRHRFLARNRLIAALSQATVVIEAGWRSGALHTAHRAAELGRPVGAFPGRVSSAESAGCHRLIRESAAVLVTSSEEVRELAGEADALEMLQHDDSRAEVRPGDGLSPSEHQVYSALPHGRPAQASRVAVRAGVSTTAVMGVLSALELSGLAERADGGWRKAPVGQQSASR